VDGKIYIDSHIGTIDGKKGIELLDVILAVKNQPKATSFTVYINSPGGIVETGFEIYDYLKSLGLPIKTIGHGMVASIATVIFMAGDSRSIRPGTKFMIHLPMGGVDGTADEISEYSKEVKDIENQLVKFYEQIGISKEGIIPLLKKETFLDPEQCKKLGFATEIENILKPVAIFKSKTKKMSKKKTLWDEVKNILSGKEVTNKIVFDVNNVELDFFELEDSEPVTVGANARVDGSPVEGEYSVVSEDDSSITLVYRFEGGELVEIIEPSTDEAESALSDEELEAIVKRLTAIEEQNKRFEKAFAKLIEAESKDPQVPKKEPSKPQGKTSRFAKAISNLSKN